eukprot:CAMPEP_0198134504 /NCGR_PEP_ID=MMETSP1442-20131203/60113_1 /TAXON_ID= /ORGANISM="Craspedostauros australis, Strain CCMP3328" /LENGTH=94 /DNA_ID=CAMNT_0043795649 /DNA_START=1257 /DNA_END=1541 /DNA_ORIENTATION=-
MNASLSRQGMWERMRVMWRSCKGRIDEIRIQIRTASAWKTFFFEIAAFQCREALGCAMHIELGVLHGVDRWGYAELMWCADCENARDDNDDHGC